MGKNILLVVSALFLSVLAVKPITVKYQEYSENAEIAGILRVLDASQVTATIYADTDSLTAKYYEIWMVERNSSETKRTKVGYQIIEPDSTKLTITAIARDSLNAVISFVGLTTGSPRVQVSVPTENHLLVGCDFEWMFSNNDTIPLVGYATGIPVKYDLGNGKFLEGFNICGIRYSKVRPFNWREEYGLPDYLYFEAVPVKEINYDFI